MATWWEWTTVLPGKLQSTPLNLNKLQITQWFEFSGVRFLFEWTFFLNFVSRGSVWIQWGVHYSRVYVKRCRLYSHRTVWRHSVCLLIYVRFCRECFCLPGLKSCPHCEQQWTSSITRRANRPASYIFSSLFINRLLFASFSGVQYNNFIMEFLSVIALNRIKYTRVHIFYFEIF